ncbi:MAG: hypothetical protein KDC87_17830 [Planctomycetes bacterium]|nr:hypothetical protein [Planctomycetota bacterium]MCB9871054.1 hypothetical protein [Planctomycetota bacterium]
MARWIRYLWAAPTTSLGLPFVVVAGLTGGGARIVTGVVEVHGGGVGWLLRRAPIAGGAAALTLGHVVLGVDRDALQRTRAHERVHVRQCERWGPLFLPAYGLASLIAWWRGGSAYADNRFEREAYACSDPRLSGPP